MVSEELDNKRKFPRGLLVETYLLVGSQNHVVYLKRIAHNPTKIYLQMAWAASHKDTPLGVHIFVAVSIFLLSIGVAYVAFACLPANLLCWCNNSLGLLEIYK